MDFNLKSLNEAGAFAGAPVKMPIKWKIGKTEHKADVYVRRLSYHTAVSEVMAYRTAQDGMAARIAGCIVDEKGVPVFTIEDITGVANPDRGALDHRLTMELLRVIGEVNDLGKPTSSPP